MSTILKALKQAEKDSSDQGDENRPSFNVRTTLSSRIQQQKRSSFFRPVRVEVLVVLSIVMAIFFYFLFFINKNIEPQTPGIGNQSQVLDTQPDIVKDPNKTVFKAEPVRQVNDSEALSNKPKGKITSPSNTSHLNKTKASVPSKPADESETIPDDNAPLIVEEPAISHLETQNPIRDEKRLLNKDTSEQELPPLKNDSLRVQAISWSDEPANRITVINNRVLQEGDSIQGYRLVIIEKDSVILHYSGSDYRLEFKYR